jgi:hypothetical protein
MRIRRRSRPDTPDPTGSTFPTEQAADAEARRRNQLPSEARSNEPWVSTQTPTGDWVLVRRLYRMSLIDRILDLDIGWW